jgi:hypothetical protein
MAAHRILCSSIVGAQRKQAPLANPEQNGTKKVRNQGTEEQAAGSRN